MKYGILFLLTLGICAPGNAAAPKKPWTFLTYLAADNSLNGEADPNIAQMAQASSSANVNILVYLNIKRDGQQKMTQRLLIENGAIHQIGQTTVEDSGSEATLLKALTWAITDFPSDYIAVDLWNHGSGSLNRAMRKQRGVCYDDTTGNYLTDLKYKAAFDAAVNTLRNGKKLDIIAFDACLMADIEVAYTLAPYAHYVVSSQQTIPGPGYNYNYVLSLFYQQNPSPLTLAQWMVTQYDRYYKPSNESYTLSLIDLSEVEPLVNATNSIANLLNSALTTSNAPAILNAINYAMDPAHCPHFDEPTYIDLLTFYGNLSNQIAQSSLDATTRKTFKSAFNNAFTAYKACVLSAVHSSDFAKAHGVSIYFSDPSVGMEPSYMNLYWTQQNPQWAQFLNQYLNSY